MQKLDFAQKLLIKSVTLAFGINAKLVVENMRKYGDLGLAIEHLSSIKKQQRLFEEELEIENVFRNLRCLAKMTGHGSQDLKIARVAELLGAAKPIEARYIARTILEDLRIGVGEGIIREALARVFCVDANEIERAYNIKNDYGEITRVLTKKGLEGLQELDLEPGFPFKVMLAKKVESIQEALKETGGRAMFEFKYDGMRAQIHCNQDMLCMFTRRLENVTEQFPEILSAVKQSIKSKSYIVEGEIVAVGENERPLPFQFLSKRIKRKYNIPTIVKKIPVILYLFDIVYLDGKSLLYEEFSTRRELLASIVKESKIVRLAEQIDEDNIEKIEAFYRKSLEKGQEGLMVKKISGIYKPGSRVGYLYKLKPIQESLDLVIIGAEWGEGRRANWLASFLLGIWDNKSKEFKSIGKMGTGLTDDQFKTITEILEKYIISEKGKEVTIKPYLVVEIGYEEIQKSPKYDSGFALRFPRLIKIRYDLGVKDVDDLEKVTGIFLSEKA
jgi:DNA ligase-1